MPEKSKASAEVPADRMPTPTKVAAIMLGILSALLLINAILTLAGLEAILNSIGDNTASTGSSFDRDAVRTQLLISVGGSAIVGVAAALAGILLVRRRPAGRWLGIACAVIQLLLAMVLVLGLGGIPIYSLLLIVITVAILMSLFRRVTVEWLRAAPRA